MPADERSPAAPLLPLATGALDAGQTGELEALKEQIQRRSGLFCGGYKENCFRRRLAVRMRARGVHAYTEYARLLDTDPEEYARLLRAITINVSRFFRNPEVWAAVRDRVLPALKQLGGPAVNFWSAGAAAGEEPYTLAILASEAARRGRGPATERVRILGTDIDPDALAAARRAVYPPLGLEDTDPAVRTRWFQSAPGGTVRPLEAVRRMVSFSRHDLLSDSYPRGQQLIVCRNAIIYFERAAQEAVLLRLMEALAPGGFLVLGKTESLVGRMGAELETVSVPARIYRRRP